MIRAAERLESTFDDLVRVPVAEGWPGTHDLVKARVDLVGVIRILRRAVDHPHPADNEEPS